MCNTATLQRGAPTHRPLRDNQPAPVDPSKRLCCCIIIYCYTDRTDWIMLREQAGGRQVSNAMLRLACWGVASDRACWGVASDRLHSWQSAISNKYLAGCLRCLHPAAVHAALRHPSFFQKDRCRGSNPESRSRAGFEPAVERVLPLDHTLMGTCPHAARSSQYHAAHHNCTSSSACSVTGLRVPHQTRR